MDNQKPRIPLELKHWTENKLDRDIPESIWNDLIEENDVDQTLSDLEQNDYSALEYLKWTHLSGSPSSPMQKPHQQNSEKP